MDGVFAAVKVSRVVIRVLFGTCHALVCLFRLRVHFYVGCGGRIRGVNPGLSRVLIHASPCLKELDDFGPARIHKVARECISGHTINE